MIHGHHTTYSRQGCRCDACREAHAVYSRLRLQAKRDGEPYTRDASRARAHIQLLLQAGFRMVDLERAMGVSNPRVKTILEDPEARVYAATEARILSTSQADVLRHCREVPSDVSCRMLRALTALGWSPADIAQVATLSTQTVRDTRDKPRPRVHRSTAELIEQAFDQLTGMQSPRGPAAGRMRALARSRGWAAPMEVVAA